VEQVAKVWHLLPHDRAGMEALASSLRVSPVVAQLLLNRGVTSAERAKTFLESPLAGLHAPELLPGAAAATDRLWEAVQQKRRICVYGDYDVDGTAGTAILWLALRLLGAQADFYVPHRLEEGYGLNGEALRQIAQTGATVVVTVDCGIASLAEAEEARRLGLELIVTDHHEFKSSLPSAAVLVHPRLPGGNYPFGGLSGAGVAFKVAWLLSKRASGSDKVLPRFREFLLDGVALAALGLVADAVPMLDENRIFVRHGLSRLRYAPTPGLKALLEAAGLGDKAALKAEHISFKLGPRLNAVGRLGSARLVIELLTTTSAQRAADLARFLDGQNSQRQQMERRMLAQARDQAAACDGASALVLADPDWHPGIVGIVASRLVDLYHRPVLMIALRPERTDNSIIGQGSGRSVPGLPLHQALEACGDELLGHGGHAAAAGFKIRPARIDAFRDRFCAFVTDHFASGTPPPYLTIDAEVSLSALTVGLVRDLDRLEPFGVDNRRPLFLATGLEIIDTPKRIGGGERHLSFRVRQKGTAMRAIAFGFAERLEELMSSGGACALVFTPKINEWQGFRRIDLEIVDFQPGVTARLGRPNPAVPREPVAMPSVHDHELLHVQ
jgi:single-stranded-DNA-specific exonuclease